MPLIQNILNCHLHRDDGDLLDNEVHEVIEHDEDDLERKLCEIFGPDVDEDSQQSSLSSNSASNFQFSLHTDAYHSGYVFSRSKGIRIVLTLF